jgi:NTE family protein
MTAALVLGGGGITGIAWEVGVLHGLRRAGVDLTNADLVVGTSAGSVVGAVVASGVDLAAAVATQREPPDRNLPGVDVGLAMQAFAIMADPSLDPQAARARVGALALAAPTGDPEKQVELFATRVPADWPERRLLITAVDAETGEAVTRDRDSGVPLVRAVAASCAVPCVYPPIAVNGRRYIDGGIRSGTNADLAAGADTVVVIAPMADSGPLGAPAAELAGLRKRSTVSLIKPDKAALAAIGTNVLDATRREPALEAGIAQGESLAPTLASI